MIRYFSSVMYEFAFSGEGAGLRKATQNYPKGHSARFMAQITALRGAGAQWGPKLNQKHGVTLTSQDDERLPSSGGHERRTLHEEKKKIKILSFAF